MIRVRGYRYDLVMAAKPRVHEIAHELGVSSKDVLAMLRIDGEYVKSPSSTVAVQAARRLRVRMQVSASPVFEPEPPESERPEAVAAAVRRNVIRRSEADWSKFDLTTAEKKRWRDAGIPEDRAHVAAMCRDSERRGESPTRLTPTNLRRRLDGDLPETVLETLLRGTNSVRTEQRLAASLGKPLRGFNQELLQLTASRSSMYRKDTLDEANDMYRAIDWTPKNAPRIADAAIVAFDSVSPTVNALYALRQQVDEYRTERKVGGLLSAYARTFGVFHVGDELDLLCTGVNGDMVSIRDTIEVRDVLAEATATRRFHYVRADAVPVLEAYTTGSDSLPPPPHGVAFIEGRFQDERRISNRVLAWSTGTNGIRCVLMNDSYFRSSKLRNFTSSRLRAEHFNDESANPASQLLAALAAVRTPPLDGPRRTARTGDADESKPSSPARLRDIVTTYVALDNGGEIGMRGARPSRAPDHRWTVKRHARRQWYPSTKTHGVIWIDEHTSGPRDAPLLHVERVEVI